MWHPQFKFPENLKLESPDKKIEYFSKDFVLRHEMVEKVTDNIKRDFFDDTEQQIALLTGPTGVGKTCIARYLMGSAYKNVSSEGPINELPMVYVEANVLGGKIFSWKDFYIDLLIALGELESVRIYGRPRVEGVNKGGSYSARSRTEAELKRDVMSRLIDYRVKFILIDEIQHIFKYGGLSGDKNLDILKGISNKTECRFVGLGTYDISFSTERSGQLARRVRLMEFPAYSLGSGSDLKAFSSAYLGLLAHLPVELSPDIVKRVSDVFLGSCGCIGILKEWLGRALKRSLEDKDKVLVFDHLSDTRLRPSQLRQIAEEIQEGRAFFVEPSEADVWDALRGSGVSLLTTSESKVVRQGSKTPGKRKPVRDVVG